MTDQAISLVDEESGPDVVGLVDLALRVMGKTRTDLARDGVVVDKHGRPLSQPQVSQRLLGIVDFRTTDLKRIGKYLGVDPALFWGTRGALLDALKESASARLSHGHLVALPSIQDRRLRVRHDAPLLTVVAHPQ